MGFSAPYTPAEGDLITAQGLTDNAEALQLWTNQGIRLNDIEADVNTQCIVQGEPFGVIPGHQFLSGDQHRFYVNSSQYNRTYMTGTDRATTILADTSRLSAVPNSGKTFKAEDNGYYFFHAWMMVIVPSESLGASTAIDPEIQLDFYIAHSSNTDPLSALQPVDYTHTTFFIEDVNYTATDSGFTNPTACGSPANRRYFPIFFNGTFDKGDYVNVCVVADCRTERAYVSARSVYIETFYL